ncbi:hypothetical protein LOK74_06000 [Brevibacillus humidisoli]|uniref:hypothetical protein n=1 Tax=Brevibacillus humidisoli TaxID=2895522 RepID=UPI001E579D0A|nr:hypothetical protein [Brevibacillus humidisoli]UFJ42049.1 hypothetical protein LOK74_06000 [Brevibacillus humidisoli]
MIRNRILVWSMSCLLWLGSLSGCSYQHGEQEGTDPTVTVKSQHNGKKVIVLFDRLPVG